MFLGGYLNVFYFHTALDLHTLDIIGCFFMITAGYFRPRVWKPKQKKICFQLITSGHVCENQIFIFQLDFCAEPYRSSIHRMGAM